MIKSKNLEIKISKTSFEDAMKRLEEIVEKLSSEKIDLENMIELYQEGELIKKHCSKKLEEAKMKIDFVNNL